MKNHPDSIPREAFCVKYSLSQGGKGVIDRIFVCKVLPYEDCWFPCDSKGEISRFAAPMIEKRDFAFTGMAAFELVEQKRKKRIKSLQDQITALEAVKFAVAGKHE